MLVEDETEIGSLVSDGLTAEGFSVDYCEDGDAGMEHATTKSYDAVVLDIMLPGKSGLEILKQLREGQNNVPVIIITARGESDDRIEGLNLGADDYLPKPFFVEELVARLRDILRSVPMAPGPASPPIWWMLKWTGKPGASPSCAI